MNSELKNKLYNLVGVAYQKLDNNGKALGCMMPIYEAYPEENGLLRFDFPTGHMDMKKYMMDLLENYCVRTDFPKDLKEGDILAINQPFSLFHVGVYLGKNDILHCSQKTGTEIIKLSAYRNRIEGGFRFKWEQ